MTDQKPFLTALAGQSVSPPPVWLMRQAGRYLPEYRASRKEAGSFLDLCYTPDFAVEVTLQPLRRYGFDAAILFSDILVVPHGLGQKLWFVEGEGPKLEALTGEADLEALSLPRMEEALQPVYQAVAGIKAAIPSSTALIGFAGAPWTVASYMLEGGSSKDFATGKSWAYGTPERFQRLIDLLVEATAQHLSRQIVAGAEAVQIFDSWAGVWPERHFRRWCLEPMKAITAKVKAAHPEIPVILFPRGAGLLYEAVAKEAGCDAVSLDTTVPLGWAAETLQPHVCVQGNLDPLQLMAGGAEFDRAVDEIVGALSGGPFVFNLGHGILPKTPPEHVSQLVDRLRGGSNTVANELSPQSAPASA